MLSPSAQLNRLKTDARNCMAQGQYVTAIPLYEQMIELEPEQKQNYLDLGLALLLAGEEAEAQTTWMFAVMEAEEEEIEQFTQSLIQTLDKTAQEREQDQDYQSAWLLYNHGYEVNPEGVNRILQILKLSLQLNLFNPDDFVRFQLLEKLEVASPSALNFELWEAVLIQLLKQFYGLKWVQAFTQVYLSQKQPAEGMLRQIMMASINCAYQGHDFKTAIDYAQLCLQVNPENIEILSHLSSFYQELSQFNPGIEVAQKLCNLATTLPDRIHGHFLIIRSLLRSGGRWKEAIPFAKEQQKLIEALIIQQPNNLDRNTISYLSNCTFFLPYLQDAPQANRAIHNQLFQLCQHNIEIYGAKLIQQYQPRKKAPTKKIKIGYISHCLRSHSVGWLARWLYEYHNREELEIYTYFVTYRSQIYDPLQDWYVEKSDQVRRFNNDAFEIAEQINQDQIDILIDLDSLTADVTMEVMALKPAPIQVTWLGWDASGLPAIDYYIADPYVLPKNAQDYYREKIWRLPQTYLAVDGFEVGVPNLRRQDLGIEADAIIYFSSQVGYKRHPDTIRLQLKILKAVPHSYFLIKGVNSDELALKDFFETIAREEGVEWERLRFVPFVASEMVHRANLQIADVVLDTYPYNGATTTMETLWMGIPLVTRVGEQFSARNSYTMMVNAGIEEGIAWSDQEYVEWGIKLGTDEKLRQEVAWKLKQSRQTAPLWQGKKFTREMEKAYQQMWLNYQQL